MIPGENVYTQLKISFLKIVEGVLKCFMHIRRKMVAVKAIAIFESCVKRGVLHQNP